MRETPKAAAAYAEYAAMGPSRSLAKLYEQLRQSNGKTTVPLRTLEAWSTAHNWQERVREHDAAIIAEKEARRLAAIDAMNERQATIGTTHQKRAIDQIGRLIESGKFGSQAAVMLLKLAIDVERTARDAPTAIERHEQSGTVTVEHGVRRTSQDDEAEAAAARTFLATLHRLTERGVPDADGAGDAGE